MTRTIAWSAAASLLVSGVTLLCLAQPAAFLWVAVAIGLCLLLGSWVIWSRGGSTIGGTPTFVMLAGVAVYIVGSLQFGTEFIYAGEIREDQWLVYGISVCVGFAALGAGFALRQARQLRSDPAAETQPGPLHEYALWPTALAFAVGTGVIWTNFLTGQIPLLSESINDARKEGVGGALASISYVGYSLTQFAFMAAIVLPLRGLRTSHRMTIVAITGSSLFLTGSRAFLVLPVLALLCLLIERRRPRLWIVLASAAAITAIVAFLGVSRAGSSGQSGNLAVNSERFGYGDGAFGAILSTLQPGPGVLSTVLTTVPQVVPHQYGAFALRDLPGVIGGEKSDYWVTTMIMGRDSQAIGGLPPTMIGGFYIDFGMLGVILGVFACFFLLAWWQPIQRTSRVTLSQFAYCFFGAYVITSYYSYLSLKVNTILFLFMIIVTLFASRGRVKNRAIVERQPRSPLLFSGR